MAEWSTWGWLFAERLVLQNSRAPTLKLSSLLTVRTLTGMTTDVYPRDQLLQLRKSCNSNESAYVDFHKDWVLTGLAKVRGGRICTLILANILSPTRHRFMCSF